MRGTSKIIMAATMVMGVNLVIVLGLTLVLIVELYCSLLPWRRQIRNSSPRNIPTASPVTAIAATPAAVTSNPQDQSTAAALPPQGLAPPPRSFLSLAVSSREDVVEGKSQRLPELHQVIDIVHQASGESPRQAMSVSFDSASPSERNHGFPPQCSPSAPSTRPGKSCPGGERLMYISNPIYDNGMSRAGEEDTSTPPFQTPDTSPSRLEGGGSAGDDDEEAQPSTSSSHNKSTDTPPLTPMKKLPAQAASVCLRDIRSLVTSGSETNSNHGISSSSSGSPCTSPSW